jgi:Domain of Unknown Function (DUF1080)
MQSPFLLRCAALVLCLSGTLIAGGCAPPATTGDANANRLTLIDGANGLSNWTTLGNADWHADDGAIQADGPNDDKGGYLVSTQSYADFQIHAEFWVTSDAKSGIFFRCQNPTVINSKTCYEVQIFDQRPDQSYGTGSLVNVAKVTRAYPTGGKWNTYDITARGSHLTIVLNGERTVEVDNGNLANGRIVLQYRGGTVRYRAFQVKPL